MHYLPAIIGCLILIVAAFAIGFDWGYKTCDKDTQKIKEEIEQLCNPNRSI